MGNHEFMHAVSVPAMVDVNGTVYHLRTDIWAMGKEYHNFIAPAMGK